MGFPFMLESCLFCSFSPYSVIVSLAAKSPNPQLQPHPKIFELPEARGLRDTRLARERWWGVSRNRRLEETMMTERNEAGEHRDRNCGPGPVISSAMVSPFVRSFVMWMWLACKFLQEKVTIFLAHGVPLQFLPSRLLPAMG